MELTKKNESILYNAEHHLNAHNIIVDPILLALYDTLGNINRDGIYKQWNIYSLKYTLSLYSKSKHFNNNELLIAYNKRNIQLCYDIQHQWFYYKYEIFISNKFRYSEYFKFHEWSMELIVP